MGTASFGRHFSAVPPSRWNCKRTIKKFVLTFPVFFMGFFYIVLSYMVDIFSIIQYFLKNFEPKVLPKLGRWRPARHWLARGCDVKRKMSVVAMFSQYFISNKNTIHKSSISKTHCSNLTKIFTCVLTVHKIDKKSDFLSSNDAWHSRSMKCQNAYRSLRIWIWRWL